MRIIKGPLPPSVLCSGSKKSEDVVAQAKVKRKCGRPRNPIPRHKRESHINAEHRRRGKIQDGFRTLKNIVPKYEQSSGRDSKADILFKAVDHCKLLQHDIQEMRTAVETLKTEKEALHADIKNYKTIVPDLTSYEHVTTSMDQHYTEYVQHRTEEHWAFGTFKIIMRPLFESYKLSVNGKSVGDFLRSVSDWAASSLSLSNLRAVCLTTLRDEPLGLVGLHTDRPTPDISHYEPGGLMTQALLSDSNNNTSSSNNNNIQCLSNHAFSSEQLTGCREDAGSACSSAGTNGGDVYSGAPDNGQSNASPQTQKCVAHVNVQHHQSSVPFSAAGKNSQAVGVFHDLYVSVEPDLHCHNHLAFTANTKTMDSLDHWQHHRFQQPHHVYQHDHFLSSCHFHELKKVHSFWSGQHQQVPHDTANEFSPGHSLYRPHLHSLSERDIKYDLATSHEALANMWVPTSASLGHRSTPVSLHNCSHKRLLSQSSSESDGSVLNMATFARQVGETLGDQDKHAQIPSSADSCLSQSSSVFMGSPAAREGTKVPVFSYSTLDHYVLQQHPSLQDRPANPPATRLSMSLPSYREAFGLRTTDYQRHSIGNFDHEMQPRWGVYGSDNQQVTSPCQGQSPHRYESSSLLAELLGQQTAAESGQKTTVSTCRTFSLSTNHNSRPASRHMVAICNEDTALTSSFETAWHDCPIKHEDSSKSEDHLLGRPCSQVKPDDAHWSVVCPVQTSQNATNPSTKTLVTCSSRFHPDLLTPNSDGSQLREVSGTSSEDMKTSSTTSSEDMRTLSTTSSIWLPHSSRPMATSQDLSLCKSKSLEEKASPADAEKHMNFFEIAHQHLINSHCLSQNRSSVSEVSPSTVDSSHSLISPTSSHKLETFNSNTQSPCNVSRLASPHSTGHVSPPGLPLQALPMSRDTTAQTKVSRKSSFEESFPGDNKTEPDTSECKKTCHWLHLSPFKQHSYQGQRADRKCGSLHASTLTECVEKSDIATLGETTLRFL